MAAGIDVPHVTGVGAVAVTMGPTPERPKEGSPESRAWWNVLALAV